jgi:hypothetical protein
MDKRHPHADATYRVLRRDDASFAVEVSIQDTAPTTVSAFATKAEAEAWIAGHKQRVAGATSLGRARGTQRYTPRRRPPGQA